MKNSSHPLLQALSRKSPKTDGHSFMPPEPDRLFQIKKEDIPSAKTFDAGDNAKFVIHGKVRSTHDDGSMMMHVQKVEHQVNEADASSAPKEPIVVTQESHTP